MAKKKKEKDLKEKTDKELTKLLAEKRKALVDYRMQQANLKLKNNQKVSQTRREIARILTLVRKREIKESIKAEQGGKK